MGSVRLPGKSLMDIGGHPVLWHVLNRLRRCTALTSIVVATTTKTEDDLIETAASGWGYPVFRGPNEDVLTRYVRAARQFRADVVVRVTADCPLIDPGICFDVVRALSRDDDFASNSVVRTYPRGLDCEAMHIDTLRKIDRLATSPNDREHVTLYAYRTEPERFKTRVVKDHADNSEENWCVDTIDDLERVRQIVKVCGYDAGWREILDRRSMWSKRSVA